jgi:hypothetical protein
MFLFHFIASNANYPVLLCDCCSGLVSADSPKQAEKKLETVYKHVQIIGRRL